MKLVTREHRLAAAMAYDGAIFEAELCAYMRDFVDGKPCAHSGRCEVVTDNDTCNWFIHPCDLEDVPQARVQSGAASDTRGDCRVRTCEHIVDDCNANEHEVTCGLAAEFDCGTSGWRCHEHAHDWLDALDPERGYLGVCALRVASPVTQSAEAQMTNVLNEKHTVEYHQVRRRLDALQAACRLPRARCIGLLEAEYKERLRRRLAALDVLFDELPKELQKR